MNAINSTATYSYTYCTQPAGAGFLQSTRSSFPTIALVAGLLLLGAHAPDLGVVPSTEIQPLDEAKYDLTLNEVVGRFESRMGSAQRATAKSLGKLVMKLSERYQMSPSLILAVIDAESSFRPSVVSKAGAVGLMQLLPETAEFVADQYHISAYQTEMDLYDPAVNIQLGVAYLSYLRHQFGNSLHYLAAYNVGPTAFRHRLSTGNYDLGALDAYVRTIHERARELRVEHKNHRPLRAVRDRAFLSASL